MGHIGPRGNFAQEKKTKKVLMGKFRKYLSGSGNMSLTIGQRGLFEKKHFPHYQGLENHFTVAKSRF